MSLLLRGTALLGSISHGLDRVSRRLLGLLPFRLPAAVVVALLLAAAAWGSAQETSRAIASRPQPRETTIEALVEEPTADWISVAGLLSGPHLDNQIYASDRATHFVRISDDPHDHVQERGQESVLEPGRRQTIFQLTQGDGVTRWFYVLRDPDGGAEAIVVRSARDASEMRMRSIEVQSAGMLDGLHHLVEVADAGFAEPSAQVTSVPEGELRIVRATLADGAEVACDGTGACWDGGTWRYLVTDAADPSATAWLDSPHPPDRQPVTIRGVIATDPGRMEIVLATDEMRVALDGLRHPAGAVLADGIGPVVPESSYIVPVVLAVIAAVIVASAAIRYPMFRRTDAGPVPGLSRPVVDELVPVEVDGPAPGVSGPQLLWSTTATIGWLRARELARRAWHLRRDLPAPGDDRPRLALLAVEGNFVILLEPIRAELGVEPGMVATGAWVHPGLRLTGPGLRLTLAFDSPAQRDRIRHELTVPTDPPPTGPLPAINRRPSGHESAWARPATVVVLALAGLLALVGGVLSLVADDAAPVGAVVAVAAGIALVSLAMGIGRRNPLAHDLLPSITGLGLVVSMLATAAAMSCGTWLTPDLAGCDPVGPMNVIPPLACVAAFGITLWATPRLPRPTP